MKLHYLVYLAAITSQACDDGAGAAPRSDAGAEAGPGFESGTQLVLDITSDAKTLVSLESASVLPADSIGSTGWDLAFTGYDVFTNSGPSGSGNAAAFGPLPEESFLGTEAPEGLPFLAPDKTGGAFLEWYFYDGTTHYLWSRLHTLGVKDGERLWKVQLITYYGERNGGPVAALYKLRYAEVTAGSTGETRTVDLDATAGGANAPEAAASGCIDLATGALVAHTVAEAASTSDWHLCARRDSLSVNGGISGPRGATSVDLDAAKTATETLDQVKARTEATEAAAFEAVSLASFDGASFTPDGVVSAFRDLWVDRSTSPPAKGTGAWVVRGAASPQLYLVGFPELRDATAQTPNHLTLVIKKVGGNSQ